MMKRIRTENLNFYYKDFRALKDINIEIEEKKITAIIGPSGCGKSTLLRCFNRMNDFIEDARIEGKIYIDGVDIYNSKVDLTKLRRKVGMVFQRPNPFPLSVYENIAFGLKIHRLAFGKEIDRVVEESLKAVGLWEELKDNLKKSALSLSLEQQQRLCIARVIALRSEIILLDEPCSALDPIATQKIEELLHKLKANYTIVIVTHNMQQAASISDYTGFMLLGELVEFGPTNKIFTNPDDKRTGAYITGRVG
jgi:phosphate transport system ATP-binding protein